MTEREGGRPTGSSGERRGLCCWQEVTGGDTSEPILGFVGDLFASLGPDSLGAMAWLLGHELAHYYKDHHWSGDFGNGLADLPVGRTLKALSNQQKKRVEIETEADYFGGFSGYVAGYNTFGIMPRALERLYTAYELDAELPGYPSLSDRT